MAYPRGKDTHDRDGSSGFLKARILFPLRGIIPGWWSTLVDQGIVSATSFLTGVIVGRSCSKEEFGLYMLGLSLLVMIMDLQASLVSTPYMVYSPQFHGLRLRLYAGSSLIHELVLSAVAMMGLTAVGAFLAFGFGPPGLGRVMGALIATITFIMFREFVRKISFAHLRAHVALLLDVCIAALQVAGLTALHLLGTLSAGHAYWVMGCACAVVGAGWFLLNRGMFAPRREQAISDFQFNWRSGRWIFASALLWTMGANVYPWLLTFFHGTASTGTWAACTGVIGLVNVVFVGMQNFLGPGIAASYTREGAVSLRRYTFRSTLLLLALIGTLSLVLSVVGDPLLVLLYGPKYGGNGWVISVLALGVVAGVVAFCFSRALFSIERADLDFKINLVTLVVLFTVGLWLVRTYGPLGAALGLSVANLASSGVRFAFFAFLTRPSITGTT